MFAGAGHSVHRWSRHQGARRLCHGRAEVEGRRPERLPRRSQLLALPRQASSGAHNQLRLFGE